MEKILGIIPARAGSKRLPGKNIKELQGKPLICHIIESAINSKYLTNIAVTSDSKQISKISNNYRNIDFINRPKHLALDKSPAIDYVNHTIESYRSKNMIFDIVVILQPTSPFTLGKDIDNCVKKLLNSNADSVVSMMKVAHHIHPSKLKLIKNDQVLPYIEDEIKIKLAHELEDIYVRNCSIYASKKHVIESGKIIGGDCKPYIMPFERSVDINDSFDFQFAKFLTQIDT
jgi:CMP-N,N'-diacetyllegionaminic acid synthase